jgi:hypothetical protein
VQTKQKEWPINQGAGKKMVAGTSFLNDIFFVLLLSYMMPLHTTCDFFVIYKKQKPKSKKQKVPRFSASSKSQVASLF